MGSGAWWLGVASGDESDEQGEVYVGGVAAGQEVDEQGRGPTALLGRFWATVRRSRESATGWSSIPITEVSRPGVGPARQGAHGPGRNLVGVLKTAVGGRFSDRSSIVD